MGKYEFRENELSLIERAPVPVAVYQFIDKRVVLLAVSNGFCNLFGHTRDEVHDFMVRDVHHGTHPDDVSRVSDIAYRFASKGDDYDLVYRSEVRGSYRIIHAVGEHIFLEDGTRLAVIHYMDEGPYDPDAGGLESGLSHALSGLLREESFFKEGYFDNLTGLPNMTCFFEVAEATRQRLVREGKQPAFVFFDFNGMKFFNDKYGFSGGNALLRAFAKLLTKHFGSENSSRFAQDHFAIIADADGLDDALLAMMDEYETINDGKTVPLKVGIYLDRDQSIDVSKACDRAKYACESHKAYRSELSYFDEDMRTAIEWRPYIIDNLDKAIEERWIQVHYQPIVRSSSGLVCDEEALARWIDPQYGLIPPGEFIPILEDVKLIYKLDLFVVDEVIRKMKDLEAAGLHVVPQSVNLSRSDFEMCDIVEEIRRRVDENNIPREKLTIEITESMVGSDFEFMKEQVKRFQDLGFSVWMDDFGSGYSSLDVLQGIHFDLIKFDMSFLRRFDEGDESKVILTELVKMAVGLGVDTLAEGVEREEQAMFLREVGCNKLQGFHYCRPIPKKEIFERIGDGKQIDFENPREAWYYSTVGRINLYDATVMAQEDAELFQRFFDTLPMAIVETRDDVYTISRSNRSFRDFIDREYGVVLSDAGTRYEMKTDKMANPLVEAMHTCSETGRKVVIEGNTGKGANMHAFVKRVAHNHVTGKTALIIVILAVLDRASMGDGVTFAHVAEALSADYIDLYYVDLDTERFVQYGSDSSQGGFEVARHGEDFFQKSHEDAARFIFEEDFAYFVESFTKEKVMAALRDGGSYRLVYRLMMDGNPRYVNMKIVRMAPDSNKVIIGISNIDAQVRQREALEREREERIAYSRITALTGGYQCIYTIDSETGRYVAYGTSQNYEALGLSSEGDDFFADSQRQCERVIYDEDWEMFHRDFTLATMLRDIERDGVYVLDYRIQVGGEVVRMRVKAAMVDEGDVPQLVVGVVTV